MTAQLAVLALLGAFNSGRVRTAAPADATDRRAALAVCLSGLLAMVAIFAWLSDPVLETLKVSEPNARIAAGIGLLVVAIHDMFASAPAPEPGFSGLWGGLVPMAIPVAFTPGAAGLAIAVGADLGVAAAVGSTIPALAVVGVVTLTPIPLSWTSWVTRSTAMFGAVVGVLVTLDGVRSI